MTTMMATTVTAMTIVMLVLVLMLMLMVVIIVVRLCGAGTLTRRLNPRSSRLRNRDGCVEPTG